jgi:hypothetical protein
MKKIFSLAALLAVALSGATTLSDSDDCDDLDDLD